MKRKKIKITESQLKRLKERLFKEAKDSCWDGYEQVGMKKKNGKEVPNCVPKANESKGYQVNEIIGKNIGDYKIHGYGMLSPLYMNTRYYGNPKNTGISVNLIGPDNEHYSIKTSISNMLTILYNNKEISYNDVKQGLEITKSMDKNSGVLPDNNKLFDNDLIKSSLIKFIPYGHKEKINTSKWEPKLSDRLEVSDVDESMGLVYVNFWNEEGNEDVTFAVSGDIGDDHDAGTQYIDIEGIYFYDNGKFKQIDSSKYENIEGEIEDCVEKYFQNTEIDYDSYNNEPEWDWHRTPER